MTHPSEILHAFTAQQAPEGGAEQATPQSCAGMAIPILLMLAVIYFMLIRPQQKQARQHEELIRGLKKGDEVVTQSGMIGRLHAITDKVVTLEVARDTRIRLLKSQVAGLFDESAEKAGEKSGEAGKKPDKQTDRKTDKKSDKKDDDQAE